MTERSFAAKTDGSLNRGWLQRKAPSRIGEPDDAYEREADRVASAVTGGQTVSRSGLSLSHIPITQVQRDNGKPKSEEEKYKEAAQKLGEAFLETDLGKKLKEQVENDPLVKGAKEAGESFISTLPGKVITGAAATGVVTTLAATHKELPVQVPEIPLDKITPGLKVKITYEGPVDSPTKAMITFSYTEQVSRGRKPAKTKTEIQREENARMAADLAKFRSGMRYAPGTPEAKQQQEEEEALKRAAFSGVGALPGLGSIPTRFPLAQPTSGMPLQLPTPRLGYQPKPFSLLDKELSLKPLEAAPELASQKKKEEGAAVQRKAANDTGVAAVPPIVDDALASPGQPLDPGTRRLMEGRFGHGFSGVRIHSDSRAAASARAISARAYTVGNDIVFASGEFSPHTSSGRWMLAHELTHVLQQGAAPRIDGGIPRVPVLDMQHSGGDVVQRGFFEWIDDLFGGTDFSHDELIAYLKRLSDKKGPVGGLAGDNKARALVTQWKANRNAFQLTQELKVYLIQEMQLGFTGDDDEQAILDLLNGSDAAELAYMFGAGGLTAASLDSDFDGEERKALHAFFDAHFTGGMAALLKGDVKPVPPATPAPAHLNSPYASAQLKQVLAAHTRAIQIALQLISDPNESAFQAKDMPRRAAEQIAADLKGLTDAERKQANADLQDEHLVESQDYRELELKIGAESEALDADKADKIKTAAHQAKIDELQKAQASLGTSVLILEIALEGSYKETAVGTSRKELKKTVTPLTKEQAKAARAAIKPDVAGVKVEVGKAPPPPPKFIDKLPGEKDTYQQKLDARAPDVVDESWNQIAKPRGVAEHGDPKKTHQLSELQNIANVSKDETDRVFGDYKKAPAFKADQRTKGGKLIARGNIHDAWADEQEKGKSAAYRKNSARFWMFYLLQNDGTVQDVNFKHHAQPAFDDKDKPLNDEAKKMEAVGNKILNDPGQVQRLFEIGRGWDAFNVGREVFIQLFKNPNALEDRKFLWDMFLVLIHEYGHSLAHDKYNRYAEKLGGEKSPEGNALIEGVDSLLTEVVWTEARPRAALAEVRNKVEPEAVKAGLPFDEKLLPLMPHRRYDTYDKALRLARVVGIKNLYAAYFLGDVKLIGGK